MSDEKSAARELLSEFQRLQDQAAAVQGTGDISLDLILAGFGSEHSVWLRQLAIPHWFNESLVSSIVPSASEASGFFSEIAAMPWVRSHPQGLVFHDQIRHRLRQSLLESKSELFREACKKLSSALLHVTENIDPNESRPATDGEIRRERIYLTLAFDESQGFEELQVEISDARKKRLINVTDALVHMAEEQLPLLSAEGKS